MRSGRGVEGGEAAVRGATVPQGEEGGEVDRLVGRPPPLRRAGGPKARREGGRGEGIRGHSRRTEGGGVEGREQRSRAAHAYPIQCERRGGYSLLSAWHTHLFCTCALCQNCIMSLLGFLRTNRPVRGVSFTTTRNIVPLGRGVHTHRTPGSRARSRGASRCGAGGGPC